MKLDAARLTARAFGRRQAKAIVDLATESAPHATDEHAVLAFWEEIRDAALTQLPSDTLSAKQVTVVPMTASEAVAFEATVVPFGKYQSCHVQGVPLRYLDWLVGQRDDPAEFVNLARRYLVRPDVAAALREELPDET